MNEEKMKEFLVSCVRSEMDLVKPEEMAEYGHEFSTRYDKKIKKVLWRDKGMEKRLYMGRTARRVAVAVIVVVSLISVTEISARKFGFRPWNYIASFDEENIMDKKEYLAPNEDIPDGGLKKSSKDIPDYVPEGFSQKEKSESTYYLSVRWKDSGNAELFYNRIKISKNMSMSVNSECDSKERVSVAGYEGYYYISGNYSWLNWDDALFDYLITADNTENAKSEVLRMAESLYRQNDGSKK